MTTVPAYVPSFLRLQRVCRLVFLRDALDETPAMQAAMDFFISEMKTRPPSWDLGRMSIGLTVPALRLTLCLDVGKQCRRFHRHLQREPRRQMATA